MTRTDWYIGIYDAIVVVLILAYLLPVLVKSVRRYHNGYTPIRWLLIFIFISALIVDATAAGYDFDLFEITDPVRIVFAIGRGLGILIFVALVWFIRHRSQ
jgi:hypothetical protein